MEINSRFVIPSLIDLRRLDGAARRGREVGGQWRLLEDTPEWCSYCEACERNKDEGRGNEMHLRSCRCQVPNQLRQKMKALDRLRWVCSCCLMRAQRYSSYEKLSPHIDGDQSRR